MKYGLNKFQKLILKCVPFRVNLFLQLNVWKKGIYFVGLNDDQRTIASKKYFEKNPPPKPVRYGPPFRPPWIEFPDYSQFSMGFRMGAGEDYYLQLHEWYCVSAVSEIEKFQSDYPPPEHYSEFYNNFDKARTKHNQKNATQDKQ